jgi:hypothetical protein
VARAPTDVLVPRGLSKLPLGLLGFFGIKNGGDYPQAVRADIQPVLDLAQMFAINYRELLSYAPVAALGFVSANSVTGVSPTVPAGEVWFISAVSVQTFTGVGDSITGSVELRGQQSGGASNWHRALSAEFTQGASLTRTLPGIHTDGLWAAPGDTIGVWYSAVTNASGTATASVQLAITRFPI